MPFQDKSVLLLTMNIYDLDYANEIREMLLDEMNSLAEIKLELN